MPDVEFILDIGGQDMKCLQRQGRRYRAHHAQRGLLLRLRLLHRELCRVHEHERCRSSLRRPCTPPNPCGPGHPLHRVHELPRQAGPEGGRDRRRHRRRPRPTPSSRTPCSRSSSCATPTRSARTCVVQGGTFMNDAALRAFEQLTGRDVIRPDMAGCMGAYGAALLARDRCAARMAPPTCSPREDRQLAGHSTRNVRCGRCSNNCLLTINDFGERHVASSRGNRCEKGAG